MSAPMLDSNEFDLAAAKDILARLERYAASVRAAPPEARDATAAPAAPPPKHPMAAATAPPDDILPVSVPWAFARQPEPAPAPRRRINPATADLFPYDLAASIVACALTIMANISLGRAGALGAAAALLLGGEWMRRYRWFPSLGIKLLIGTVVGLVLVLTA